MADIRSVSIPKQIALDLGFDFSEIEKFPLETTQKNIIKPFEKYDFILNDSEKNGDINKLIIPNKESEYIWVYYPIISQ